MVYLQRVYEKQRLKTKKTAYRVLVDRLWPRGLSKETLGYDEWLKDLAPSNELRKFFSHDVNRWKDFVKAYQKELKTAESKKKISELAKLASKKDVVLLYAAKDEEHNNAVVLKGLIESAVKSLY